MGKDRTSREATVTGTKIVYLYRGAQDGLQIHTTADLESGDTLWVPSHDLIDIMNGSNFAEIKDILDDPENEEYLPYEAHLIAYEFEDELEPEQNLPTYVYVECPETTYARIAQRQSYDQEHQ